MRKTAEKEFAAIDMKDDFLMRLEGIDKKGNSRNCKNSTTMQQYRTTSPGLQVVTSKIYKSPKHTKTHVDEIDV